jgi:paraquat-inducible protein B
MRQVLNDDYRIPVLVRIEPERLKASLAKILILVLIWRID